MSEENQLGEIQLGDIQLGEKQLEEVNITDTIMVGLVSIVFFVVFSGKIYDFLFSYDDLGDDDPLPSSTKIEVKYEDKYRDQLLHMDTPTNPDTKSLDNSFICEYTPIGNVIMKYNNARELFEYYSDISIPYRYLETVCRKYVITFKCPHLYIDMESAIKDSEQKHNERIISEKESQKVSEKRVEHKKNVFAKFKSYNKDAGSGKINTGAPPKNSIPNNKSNDHKENVAIKEMANRYLYQGKICNFSVIKKVVRNDKRQKMTFADFKRLSLMK